MLCAQWEEALGHFKARLASGEDVFGPLIRKFLLSNLHRVTLVSLPDSQLGKAGEEREKSELAAVRAALPPAEVGPLIINPRHRSAQL